MYKKKKKTNLCTHNYLFIFIYIAGKSVLQIMQNSGLSEFVRIVNVAGLAQTFENVNALTVFAPTNQAIRCK